MQSMHQNFGAIRCKTIHNRSHLWALSIIPAVSAALFSAIFVVVLNGIDGFELSGFLVLAVPASLAAGITGIPCWWLVIKKPGKFTTRRHIIAGLLCGVISHPFLWIIFSFGIVIVDENAQALHFMDFIKGVLSMSMISLLFVGWITALIGAFGGWLYFRWCESIE